MPCDRLSLLKRLAVDSPAQLQTSPWREHMEDCGECRMEKQVMEGTLAVFKQIESEGRVQKEFGPSWEAFSHAVDQAETIQPIPIQLASGGPFGEMAAIQEPAQAEKPRTNRRWRSMASLASAASVATVAATVVGVMFWPVDPLPESPRKEASSAAPGTERAAGNAKSFRIGGESPATSPLPPPQSARRFIPTPKPVFRELAGPSPSFGQNRWRGGAGNHPAPVILFRSLQNRKSMGIDRPFLGEPAGRVSPRTVARPAKRRRKAGGAIRPLAPRRPKTAPPPANRGTVVTQDIAKGSPRRSGGGAGTPQVAVEPVFLIPAGPFSPEAFSRAPASRPEAEVFIGILPAGDFPFDLMLAPPNEKMTLQARMEEEELAKADAETKQDEADFSLEYPESQIDAKLEDSFQPAEVTH